MIIITTTKEYLQNCERFGARVGDRVTVIKAYKGDSGGWDNSWPDGMNKYIGRSGIITMISRTGHYIDFEDGNGSSFGFPWFSLKIVR